MSDSTLRRLAGGFLVLCTVLLTATLVGTVVVAARGLEHLTPVDFWTGFFFLLASFVYSIVGTLVARRQPRNAIGWLLIAVAMSWAVGFLASSYADYGVNADPGSLPAPALVNALVAWTWVPALGLMATFVVLLFPDGHLPSPRWRWLAWLSAIVMVITSLGMATDPHAFADSPLEGVANPLGIPKPPWLQAVELAIFALFPLCILACAAAAVLRYRRTTGVERLQMKWLVTAGAFFAGLYGSMLLFSAVTALDNNAAWDAATNFVLPSSFLLFPLAIGAAVLKYRLYDIDIVINRSLVFGALATFITAVYVTVVVGIGHLVGTGDRPNLALSVAATAIIAVAFEPVRNRLQRLVNRLVYGERATPYEVLSSFADRVGGAYDATELLPLMARTVGQGVDATAAQVWLHRAEGFELAATWGSEGAVVHDDPADQPRADLPSVAGDRVVEVRDRGELLGAVSVTKRPGRELSSVEERLLATLAAQAGPVLRNVRLIEDLRSSRQRVVSLQDEERRRLERNLHDGAQQSLVAVALMIRLAQPTIAARSAAAGECLERAAAELGAAVEELRDLARGIYPVVLADRGLGAALTSLAERSPVPVVVDVDLDDRVPPDVERALYFIVAEALTTSLPAGAGEATVALSRQAGVLTLRLDDDGAPADDSRRGLPLQGLLDRAAVVDAALAVEDAPAGLHLTCTVAVPEPPSSPSVGRADVTAVPLGAGQ